MITVRDTVREEAETLAEIQKQAFLPLYEKYHADGNPCLRGKEDILDRLGHPRFRYFTIQEDGCTVGGVLYRCAGKTPFFVALGEGEYYIQRVYVVPKRQCCGIAQAAILLCEEKLAAAKRFWVDFPEDLDKNRRCYLKAGFHDTGKRLEIQPGLVLVCFEKSAAKRI